jgi:hypothetical protein
MSKFKPVNRFKRKLNNPVSILLDFINSVLPEFVKNFPFEAGIIKMNEDALSEALVFFLLNRARTENFSFISQPNQKGRRKVDIGVFLFGNNLNYLFCIEVKLLPHPRFDYVTGENAAIKRFKANEHGLNNCDEKIPLPQSGIIAFVKSGNFEKHKININEKIQTLATTHSQKNDEFGLTWNNSEQLVKVYFNSIGRLSSKHPRKDNSEINLHHFWIYVN